MRVSVFALLAFVVPHSNVLLVTAKKSFWEVHSGSAAPSQGEGGLRAGYPNTAEVSQDPSLFCSTYYSLPSHLYLNAFTLKAGNGTGKSINDNYNNLARFVRHSLNCWLTL
jgi:hypothetical protein